MDRRQFLMGASASVFFTGLPVHGFTQDLPPGNIIAIFLEGGMDGLACVPPIGDPSFEKRRSKILSSNNIEITDFFALHPSMRNFGNMLRQNDAAIVHATSIPYIKRSHFEGQNVAQTGMDTPYASKSGWLGRAAEMAGLAGRALSLDTPLLIRGTKEIDNFFPAHLDLSVAPSKSLLSILSDAHDGEFQQSFEKLMVSGSSSRFGSARRGAIELAQHIGEAMQDEEGPRIAVIRVDDFDTHAGQGTLTRQLRAVDDIFGSLKKSLGSAWDRSIVLTITEFGRTVSQNGSAGTDHGYGTAGLLAGGLLPRSSVLANWPGLNHKNLFEKRDLYATLDYRSVCAACIEAAFGLPHDQIASEIFEAPNLARTYDYLFA